MTVPIYGPVAVGLDYRYASAFERIDSDFSRFVPDAELTIAQKVFDARLMARWQHLRIAFLVKNVGEYYYVERPAILAPPRHFTLQVQANF